MFVPDTVLGSEGPGTGSQRSPDRTCNPSTSIYFRRVQIGANLGTKRKHLKIIHLTRLVFWTYKELSNLTLRKNSTSNWAEEVHRHLTKAGK